MEIYICACVCVCVCVYRKARVDYHSIHKSFFKQSNI